jgi:hypothetical protein
MAIRKPADETAPPASIEDRLTAIEAENAAIARAICALAVSLPGPPASTERILSDQFRIRRDDAAAIIAAASRTG